MSNALIAPEYELFPNRYRWTVQECYEMAAEGRLVGRYEILDGEVVSKMGQNPAHSNALKRLMRVLTALFGLDLLWVQSPITLPGQDHIYNEPEPDIAVTRQPEDAYVDRHPGPEDLLLVAEVSDTTIRTDLIIKARLYARAGITEYWVVDLTTRQLYIHREPENGQYRVVSIHAETDTVTLIDYPAKRVAVADLLPPTA